VETKVMVCIVVSYESAHVFLRSLIKFSAKGIVALHDLYATAFVVRK
jgi:hypothetical protein